MLVEPRIYIIFVIALSIIISCIDFCKIELDKKKIIFAVVLLITFIACYPNFSTSDDFCVYSGYFDVANNSDLTDFQDSVVDYGFLWITALVSLLGGSTVDLYAIVCAIDLYIYYRLFPKFTKSIFIAWMFFCSRRLIYSDVMQIRQGLAMAILLIALNFVLKKDLKKFILTVLVAALIHKTALVFLLVYPISTINWNKKRTVFFVAFSLVCILFPLSNGLIYLGNEFGIGAAKLLSYANTFYFNPTDYGALAKKIIICILCIIVIYNSLLDRHSRNVYLTTMLLALFTSCALSDIDIFSGRLSQIYMISFMFLPAIFYDGIRKRTNRLITVSMMMLLAVYFSINNIKSMIENNVFF